MKSVLVIDDSDSVREILCDILGREGYAAYGADNGKTGVALYRANPVDLVITDIFMPEKDGIETIRELKKEFPSVEIIVMSGGSAGPVDFLGAAKALGVRHVLRKPFDPGELIEAVHQAVNTAAE